VRYCFRHSALEHACKLAKVIDGHIGWEHLSLQQAVKRMANIMYKFGITKAEEGVTLHGLRNEYINDGYEKITGQPSPVRGGVKADVDPELDLIARTKMSHEAGHGRTQITAAYAGSFSRKLVPN